MLHVIIFSVTNTANKGTRSEQYAHAEVTQLMAEAGIQYKEVKGCYKGVEEISYVVDGQHVGFVEDMCRAFYQESYLRASKVSREATLVYTEDGRREGIGTFVLSSKGHALTQDAYTYDERANQYWVVE